MQLVANLFQQEEKEVEKAHSRVTSPSLSSPITLLAKERNSRSSKISFQPCLSTSQERDSSRISKCTWERERKRRGDLTKSYRLARGTFSLLVCPSKRHSSWPSLSFTGRLMPEKTRHSMNRGLGIQCEKERRRERMAQPSL